MVIEIYVKTIFKRTMLDHVLSHQSRRHLPNLQKMIFHLIYRFI